LIKNEERAISIVTIYPFIPYLVIAFQEVTTAEQTAQVVSEWIDGIFQAIGCRSFQRT
jgi:hypothetical protein